VRPVTPLSAGIHGEKGGWDYPGIMAIERKFHGIAFLNERFIAPINIKTYTIVTKLFLNYNQFTTVS
jgi:hypothetical protein